MSHRTQVVVIGGDRARLAAGYQLGLLVLEFVILDT